jgi:putative transposase
VQKYSWGGYRPGSGRRPKGEVSGVSHHTRGDVSSRNPVLVTLRTKIELGSLRKKRIHGVIRGALAEGCDIGPFRICHYAVQPNGVLLIVEAEDRAALSRGMQGVNVRIAKSLNRLWERNGSVFSDRYETVVLKGSQAVRDTLCHVLNNARLHENIPRDEADPFSSAAYFDGWKHPPRSLDPVSGVPPVAKPRSAALKSGWRKHGLLDVNEVPRTDGARR